MTQPLLNQNPGATLDETHSALAVHPASVCRRERLGGGLLSRLCLGSPCSQLPSLFKKLRRLAASGRWLPAQLRIELAQPGGLGAAGPCWPRNCDGAWLERRPV